MLALYTVTIFLGAGLLFLVQPMIAKRLLPLLGGSPAVWNTCMVFFQAALLLGYAYAHALAGRLPARRGALVHCSLLLGSVAVLAGVAVWSGGAPPISPRPGAQPPPEASPIPWLLSVLALSVGLPFTITATGGPILQRWFAATGHRSAADPYFLYAASNAGSLIALLGYPLLLEPALRLRAQEWVWCAGYAAFAALVTVCAWRTFARPAPADTSRQERRFAQRRAPAAPAPAPDARPVTAARRLRWVLLAFVPSSLLLGVTQYVSTDVAAFPLLWVVPLSIYLLTFILAFGSRQRVSPRLTGRAMAVLAAGLAAVMYFEDVFPFVRQASPITLLLLMHGLALFLGAMVCHGRLAADRPDPARLTEFYLLISLGGVLGGAFNALLAPLVFDDVYEYPIALVLACALIPREAGVKVTRLSRVLDAAVPLAMTAALLSIPAVTRAVERAFDIRILGGFLLPLLVIAIIATPALLSLRRPGRLAMIVGGAFLALTFLPIKRQAEELRHRTFFGVYRVYRTDAWRTIVHGTTTHGVQAIPGELPPLPLEGTTLTIDMSRVPTSYYHPTGPLGEVIAFKYRQAQAGAEPFDQVGVVGLGAGAIAAFALPTGPGEPPRTFTFYDIEPFMARVARDPAYFTYLRDAEAPPADPARTAPRMVTVVGDGRLELAKEPDGRFDLIVLDAFSSDAIPVHLITREAVELYMRKLAPGGLLAFHVSNRYLNLLRVLGAIARDLGVAWTCRDEWVGTLSEDEKKQGKQASTWAVLARRREDLGPHLVEAPGQKPPYRWWSNYPVPADFPVWTDDYSNIIAAFSRW